MRSVSKKRAKLNRLRRQIFSPRLAAGTPCELQLPECAGRAADLHEVKTRGRLGSIIDPNNVVFLCRPCHEVVTANSGKEGWAIRHGWVASSSATFVDLDTAWEMRHTFVCGLQCDVDHRGEL